MKKLFLSLFSLIACFAVSHATLVTFDFVNGDFVYELPTDFIDSGTEVKIDPVTVTLFKDEGTNGMRVCTDGMRFYKNSNAGFTVSVPAGCTISEIRMEDSTGSWAEADGVGSYDPNTYVWTGEATSVKFKFMSSSTQHVGRLQVTYEGTPQKVTYPVTIGTYDEGMLQVFAGATWVGNGTSVDEGSTLSITAIAYDGYEVSSITANGIELELMNSEGNMVGMTTVTGPTEIAATFASTGASYQTPSGTTHANKYLTSITTTGAQSNIDVAYDAHPGQVYNFVVQTVTAAAGSEFTLNLNAYSLGDGSIYTTREDMRFNIAYVFADWNGTGEFTLLTTYGLLPPSHNVYGNYDEVMNIACPIAVPADVVAGGAARIRVIYSNAWDVPGTNGALRPADGHTVAEVDPNTAYINQGIAYDIVVNTVASYTVTFETPANGSISVMNGDVALESGALVAAGTQLVISATPAAGYVLSTLTVNGTQIESGGTYTVGEENVAIAATFVEKPKQSIFIPGGSYSNYSNYYTFRFDDAPLGSHVNGSNTESSDLRSRNLTYSAWINIKNAGGGVIMGNIQKAFSNATGAFIVTYKNKQLCLGGRTAKTIKTFDNAIPTASTDEGTELNEWVFVTVVADQAAGKVTLYKNCREISSYDTDYGVGLLEDEAVFFVSDQAASIAISEVQLWNKALTVDEIKDSYNLEFETAPEGLVACYRPDALVEGSTTELRNLGTEGTTPAKFIYGYYYNSWGNPYFNNQVDSEFQFVDEFRTLATVNVTVNQPEVEGCSVTVTGKDGREIDGQANLYEYLTIVPQLAEGAELKTVDVEDATGIVNYTLDQLVPVRANSDMTIGLTMVKKYTLTANVTNGSATASINDAEAQEIPAEGLLVEEGSKVVVTLVPASDKHLLESFTVNDVDNMENLVENAYTIDAIDADYALVASFAEKTMQSVLIPGGDSYSTYSYYNSFRFDDAPLGSHVNGQNDDADFRSRNLTYSAWVNIKSAGGGVVMGNIQTAFTDATGAFIVKYSDGKLSLKGRNSDFSDGNVSASTDEGTALNEWVFVTVVADREAGKVTLYKNAREISSYTTTNGVGLLPDESSFFISDKAASIAFSEVQLWNKALTVDEIKDTYNFKFETAPEGLVAYYKPGEFVEGSTTELRNLGTEGTTTAKVLYGQYIYDSSNWSPYFKNQVAQDIQMIDEYRTLATVNVTVNQPEVEGCTLTVTGEDGREIDGQANLYEYLTIVPQIAEGAEYKTVDVTDAEGTVKYALDQLVPVRANSDMTIALAEAEKFTLTASVVNGTVTASVNDGMAQEIPAEGLLVESGSKVVVTLASAGDKYSLKSFTVNDVDNMENVVENVYTIEAIAENTAISAVFSLPTFHLSVVNPEPGDRSFYGEFRNNMNVRFDYDDEDGVDVEENTRVFFAVIGPKETGYNNLVSVTDNDYDVTKMLQQMDGVNESIYAMGAIKSDHTLVVTQDAVVGIVAVGEDGENMLSFTDGVLNVNAEGAVIEVIDMNGRLVARSNGSTLAVDGLVSGVYVARATVDGAVHTIKFIKL